MSPSAAFASPWYQIIPRAAYGAHGSTIAFQCTDGWKMNVRCDLMMLGQSASRASFENALPSTGL